MTRSRLITLGAACLTLAGVFAAFDPPAPARPEAPPPYAEVNSILRTAYDVSRWTARVPAEWAAPRVARAGLDAWLETLPLEEAARGRIRARLDAPVFVDEVVPFALFVKEMYTRPDVDDFATWARTHVVARPGVPGFEHSIFTLTPPAPAASTGIPSLPADQAARLLALYDAVWLQETGPNGDALRCGAVDDASLGARADRAATIVRALLAEHADGLEPGDMKDAVAHILRDDTTRDAITLTLIEFIDGEVCKHHRIFASQVQREHQLAAFLAPALLDGTRDDGWTWLRWHAGRRRAVHIVVDGLQGHLVAALAGGRAHDPFLTEVLAEGERHAAQKPDVPSAKPGPEVSTGALRYAVEHGAAVSLPTLARAVASAGYVRQGISTTPTISVRNLPIVMTGAPVAGPGATGIPNFHFVDRGFVLDGVQQGRPWYFYGNDALQLTRLTAEAGMTTLFSRFQRLGTMSCGGQYDELAGYSFDSLLSLAVGEKSRDFGDVRCVGELRRRAANERRIAAIRDDLLAREPILHRRHRPWEWYDRWAQATEREAVEALVAELAALEPVGLPDYLLYYSPWPDHFAHAKGPFSDEIIGPTGELARLDHWLGEITAAYEGAGLGDRVLFGMAGDHGLTTVRWIVSPEEAFVEGLRRDGVSLRVKKISSDEGEGPKLTHRLRPPSMRGFDVVVASTAGGNYMLDFFVDQEDGWSRQPVLSELSSLTTIGGRRLDVPAELLRRLGDSLDYLVVREDTCDPTACTTVVMGPRDGRTATGRLIRRGDRIWYAWEGADLLGLDERAPYGTPSPEAEAEVSAARARCMAVDRADPDTWCSETEWRALTRLNRRPDAVTQLAHLYDTDRAGTVNLFPRDGVGYNTQVPGRHAGEAFHEKDAFVGVWGAPVRAAPASGGPVATAVNGAVPQAMAAWLTGETIVPGEDGWGYPPLPSSLWSP